MPFKKNKKVVCGDEKTKKETSALEVSICERNIGDEGVNKTKLNKDRFTNPFGKKSRKDKSTVKVTQSESCVQQCGDLNNNDWEQPTACTNQAAGDYKVPEIPVTKFQKVFKPLIDFTRHWKLEDGQWVEHIDKAPEPKKKCVDRDIAFLKTSKKFKSGAMKMCRAMIPKKIRQSVDLSELIKDGHKDLEITTNKAGRCVELQSDKYGIALKAIYKGKPASVVLYKQENRHVSEMFKTAAVLSTLQKTKLVPKLYGLFPIMPSAVYCDWALVVENVREEGKRRLLDLLREDAAAVNDERPTKYGVQVWNELIDSIANAMTIIHDKGIVFEYIGLRNIFVHEEDGKLVPTYANFCDSPIEYRAPELHEVRELYRAGEKSDVFLLGTLIKALKSYVRDIDLELKYVAMACTLDDPLFRPPFNAVADVIHEIAEYRKKCPRGEVLTTEL